MPSNTGDKVTFGRKKTKNKKINVVLQINDPYRCFLVSNFKTKKCESFSVSVNRENFNTILQKSIKAMQLDLGTLSCMFLTNDVKIK